ncbi:hypothetical protein BaRGS_00039761, partial [Batillaria attramentaria]
TAPVTTIGKMGTVSRVVLDARILVMPPPALATVNQTGSHPCVKTAPLATIRRTETVSRVVLDVRAVLVMSSLATATVDLVGNNPCVKVKCSAGHYSPNLGCKACGAGCEDVTSCDTLSGLCSCRTGWEPPTCHANADKDGNNTGAIVGSVVGVGVVICIAILVAALLIIRSRRSRQPQHEEQHETSISTPQEKETPIDLPGTVTKTNGSTTEEEVNHYDKLASYENSDDIKPYTSLQANQPSARGPHTRTTTPSDSSLYEIPDVHYENTRKK